MLKLRRLLIFQVGNIGTLSFIQVNIMDQKVFMYGNGGNPE